MHSKLIDDKRWEVISVDSSLKKWNRRVMRSSVLKTRVLVLFWVSLSLTVQISIQLLMLNLLSRRGILYNRMY